MSLELVLNTDQALELLRLAGELVTAAWALVAAAWVGVAFYAGFEGVRLARLIIAHRRWEHSQPGGSL